MYLSRIRIQNYRCFDDVSVEFNSGINVIIGENNAGKTALLKAIGLLFDRNNRPDIQIYDFNQSIADFSEPPSIIVTATLTSSPRDTIEDKALVATWLTNLESPWEAQLTYVFSLSEEAIPDFNREMNNTSQLPENTKFWNAVQRCLPKYTSRIYGGPLDASVKAEPEFLNKFEYHFLDAIRDVESKLFSGSNPMLKKMLHEVLDFGVDDADRSLKGVEFSGLAGQLTGKLIERIHLPALTELVNKTGAEDGGTPTLSGSISEQDLIAALKLFIEREGLSLPATYNGLGYNNLIYISLVLASLKFRSSVARRGPNAALFPMLLIEEPEAHLHPSLQYKLLKYIRERVERTNDSRQVFVTSHSTHITAASELDSIICMSAPGKNRGIKISYPGRVFPHDSQGRMSKKYVERYLDATKSNMLFAKGIIFVEGIAEQLLVPCFAEYIGTTTEERHVAIIGVGGSTFKHFLPLFGMNCSQECSLDRRVACLLDGDPMLRRKEDKQRKKCWPYQIEQPKHGADCYAFSCIADQTQYFPISSTVQNLKTACADCKNIRIFYGSKTLEYDLAMENTCSSLLIGAVSSHKDHLQEYAQDPAGKHEKLEGVLNDETRNALSLLDGDADFKSKTTFSTYYLSCVESSKGEHAFDLAIELKQNHEKPESERMAVIIPAHIREAILWASGQEDSKVGS